MADVLVLRPQSYWGWLAWCSHNVHCLDTWFPRSSSRGHHRSTRPDKHLFKKWTDNIWGVSKLSRSATNVCLNKQRNVFSLFTWGEHLQPSSLFTHHNWQNLHWRGRSSPCPRCSARSTWCPPRSSTCPRRTACRCPRTGPAPRPVRGPAPPPGSGGVQPSFCSPMFVQKKHWSINS